MTKTKKQLESMIQQLEEIESELMGCPGKLMASNARASVQQLLYFVSQVDAIDGEAERK